VTRLQLGMLSHLRSHGFAGYHTQLCGTCGGALSIRSCSSCSVDPRRGPGIRRCARAFDPRGGFASRYLCTPMFGGWLRGPARRRQRADGEQAHAAVAAEVRPLRRLFVFVCRPGAARHRRGVLQLFDECMKCTRLEQDLRPWGDVRSSLDYFFFQHQVVFVGGAPAVRAPGVWALATFVVCHLFCLERSVAMASVFMVQPTVGRISGNGYLPVPSPRRSSSGRTAAVGGFALRRV